MPNEELLWAKYDLRGAYVYFIKKVGRCSTVNLSNVEGTFTLCALELLLPVIQTYGIEDLFPL